MRRWLIDKDVSTKTPIAKTLESISIRNRSDAIVVDRCLIDVDPMVFANMGSFIVYATPTQHHRKASL